MVRHVQIDTNPYSREKIKVSYQFENGSGLPDSKQTY